MKIINDIPVWGDAQENAVYQMQNALRCDGYQAALMGDHHLGYSVPVGGVIAYDGLVSPSGVGFDIACLDGETEFLSPFGWRKISDWSGEEVLQYDPESDNANFVEPDRYIEKDCEEFLHFKNKYGLDQMVTPDHKMLLFAGYKGRGYNRKVMSAQELSDKHHSLTKGFQGGFKTTFGYQSLKSLPYSDAWLRVFIMVCADGRIKECKNKTNRIELHLRKNRKIHRAESLLHEAYVPYTKSLAQDGSTYIYFDFGIDRKNLSIFWQANSEQLQVLSDECIHWDGHNGEHRYFSTTKEEEAEIVQFAMACSGIRANIHQPIPAEGHSQSYCVYETKNQVIGMTPNCVSKAKSNGKAYCFSVDSGFFVARRNGKIFITGNCGNKAVLTDADADEVRANIESIMDKVAGRICFGIGRNNKAKVDHDLFDDDSWEIPEVGELKDLARNQLGTVGSGNHYVDIFVDELDRVWIGVHFGSRGLGHKIATHYIKEGGGTDGMFVDPVVLDSKSDVGQRYIAAMNLAGRYAYAGRDYVCDTVAGILGAHILDEVHNHHNFAWLEKHDGKDLWVVRKGATPAFPQQRGFVGGSMGEDSVILEGVDHPECRDALYSTVHGAGRVLSRSQAAGKVSWKKGKKIRKSEGCVTQTMMQEWLDKKGVVLRGGGVDESPHCYKRLHEVLDHHSNTVRILHTLTPLGVAMAGSDIADPYRD